MSLPAKIVLFLLAVSGVFRLKFGNDPSQFYRPDPFLAAGEKAFFDLGMASAESLAVVSGFSVQDALEREEAAGVKGGVSEIVPSFARQRENAALVDRLCEKEGAAYTAATGLPVVRRSVPPPDEALLDASAPPHPMLAKMLAPRIVRDPWFTYLVTPAPKGFKPSQGVAVFSPRAALQSVFDEYQREAFRLLEWSLACLAALLVAMFGRRVPAYAMPVLGAALATAGVLGWMGETLNFFHVLCFFVFVGLGMDYAIFHAPVPGAARTIRSRVVLFSFLSSFVGLGLLAFTDLAVTRAMGRTLATGLLFSYLFSLPSRATSREPRTAAWHEQREQSAGRLRLLFMWNLYALFGKTAAKLATVAVMAFVYPFARPARRSLEKFYSVLGGARPGTFALFRHLLGFAWSLVDKTDACTLKKNLPRIAARDDDGWRDFSRLVESGRGAFLVSTHLGTAEVLPALPVALASGGAPARIPRVHAFQQMSHDAVFTDVFMRHFDHSSVTLHPVEEIGVETAVEMKDAISRGELVIMAGDRPSAGAARTRDATARFLGVPCRWPRGTFVFARLMESPVFFVTCVRTGFNSFEAHFERFAPPEEGGASGIEKAMLDGYVAFLERETRARPSEWFHFHDFFADS